MKPGGLNASVDAYGKADPLSQQQPSDDDDGSDGGSGYSDMSDSTESNGSIAPPPAPSRPPPAPVPAAAAAPAPAPVSSDPPPPYFATDEQSVTYDEPIDPGLPDANGNLVAPPSPEPITFTARISSYDCKTDKWTHSNHTITVTPRMMSMGSLRAVFPAFIPDHPSGQTQFVAKIARPDVEASPRTYYADVKVHAVASAAAKEFAQVARLRKKVAIVPAELVTLPQPITLPTPCGDATSRLLHIEPRLVGSFVKQSNNLGYVHDSDRNTPAAFSHFTYKWSRGTVLVCDLQGISTPDTDVFTDPQVHTAFSSDAPTVSPGYSGKIEGCLGDMAGYGMSLFFDTHRCNAVCRALRLELISPKPLGDGTLPMMTLGGQDRVGVLPEAALMSQVLGSRYVAAASLRGVPHEALRRACEESMRGGYVAPPPLTGQVSSKSGAEGEIQEARPGAPRLMPFRPLATPSAALPRPAAVGAAAAASAAVPLRAPSLGGESSGSDGGGSDDDDNMSDSEQ